MAMEDNTVLPAASSAGGMNPQIQAFLNLLMGGGLHEFGAFGGQPFGGFGNFLMQNPTLMRGLGLLEGAMPGFPRVPGVTPANVTPAEPASAPLGGGGTSGPGAPPQLGGPIDGSTTPAPLPPLGGGAPVPEGGSLNVTGIGNPNPPPLPNIAPPGSLPLPLGGFPRPFSESIGAALPPLLRKA